jgi:hypothetical protein
VYMALLRIDSEKVKLFARIAGLNGQEIAGPMVSPSCQTG